MDYKQPVVSTFSAPRTSGNGHYAASILACGHHGACELKPTVYACGGCGAEKGDCNPCPCGYFGFLIVFLARAERPEDRATQPGDVLECGTCKSHADAAARLRELSEPVFRARYSERWGGQYHLYRRDETSPSGVMLIMTVSATPEIDEILKDKQISPLSPTER